MSYVPGAVGAVIVTTLRLSPDIPAAGSVSWRSELVADHRVNTALQVRGGVRRPQLERDGLAGRDLDLAGREAGHAQADRDGIGRGRRSALAEEVARGEVDTPTEDGDHDQREEPLPDPFEPTLRGLDLDRLRALPFEPSLLDQGGAPLRPGLLGGTHFEPSGLVVG